MEYIATFPKPSWIEDLLADSQLEKHMPRMITFDERVDFGILNQMRFTTNSCIAWALEELENNH